MEYNCNYCINKYKLCDDCIEGEFFGREVVTNADNKSSTTNVIKYIDCDRFECGECGLNVTDKDYIYCPNCGYKLGEIIEEVFYIE